VYHQDFITKHSRFVLFSTVLSHLRWSLLLIVAKTDEKVNEKASRILAEKKKTSRYERKGQSVVDTSESSSSSNC